MIAIRQLIIAALLWTAAPMAMAQLGLPTGLAQLYPQISAPSYTGPGDINSGATMWGSCTFAYSASVASAGTNACALRRSSDNGTCTVITASSGLVDYTVGTPCSSATALSWMTRETFTGTATASTSLSTTGDSCTAVTGDQIIGSGITSPTTVTKNSCSTGVGSYTMSQSWTLSSVAITDLIPTFVSTQYDQTGGNQCSSANCNFVQATSGSQPQLLLNCMDNGTLACLESVNASMTTTNSFSQNAAAQLSMELVQERGNNNTFGHGIFELGATNYLGSNNGNFNSIRLELASAVPIQATATDQVLHSVIAVAKAGSGNDIVNIDGTESTGTQTPGTTAGDVEVLNSGTLGYFIEQGLWDNIYWTSTQRSNLCANVASRAGTTVGSVC